MISYEFTIQEIIANLMDPYISNEFLFWIKHKHYPILRLTREDPFNGKLSQHFNTTSYGEWLIPVKLIYFIKPVVRNNRIILTRESPVFNYTAQADWTMVDIQQAGKYVPQNYLYTGCQAPPTSLLVCR